MAPRLSRYQRNPIHGMLEAQTFSDTEIATAACTTDRSIRSIRRNLRVFGKPTAPCLAKPGPVPILTKTMVEALLHHLIRASISTFARKREVMLQAEAWYRQNYSLQ